MSKPPSIIFRGKEVRNPLLRKLFVGVAVFYGSLAVLFGFIMIPIAFAVSLIGLAFTPLWVILHFLLVALGRRGFLTYTSGHIQINVGPDGFRKADHVWFFQDSNLQDELIRKLRRRDKE